MAAAPAGAVAAGNRHRIVVGAEDASRGRSALALGDDVDAIGPAQRRAEHARPAERPAPPAASAARAAPARRAPRRSGASPRRSSPAGRRRRWSWRCRSCRRLIGHRERRHPLERHAPRPRDRSTSAASAMPSASDAASPAINSAAPAFRTTMSRAGPRSPASTARMSPALSAADAAPNAPPEAPWAARRRLDADRRC